MWLFNAELLSKIGNKASEHVSIYILLLPNLKTRHRYNTGIDFKQTEWYKLFQNPMLLQPESYIARQFQRRHRLPYPCFLDLVNDVKEYSIFNLSNPYSNNLKIPMELKCMVALRMLGRDLCCCDITAHTELLYVLFCLTYMYCTLYVLYLLHTVHIVHVPFFPVSDVEVSPSTSVN